MTEQQNREYATTSKALKLALRGLNPEQISSLVAEQDKSYDYARSQGFDDFTSTMFAFNSTTQKAKSLKMRTGR